MSRFGKMVIDAFLTIGHAEVDLDGRGFVSIAGESDETAADSNGAGKSSVADAVAWACWGETARGVSADEVINAKLGKGTRVVLPILDGADVYEIHRHRKHAKGKNSLQLFQNGVDITRGTSQQTQRAIEQILGCSQEVFNASVYIGQEQMPDLPAMTDKHLKTLVEQAAGVDVLTRAHETAREKMRDASHTRADAQVGVDRARDRWDQISQQITQTEQKQASWDAGQAGRIAAARTATVDAVATAKTQQASYNPQETAELEAAIVTSEQAIASVSGEQDRERILAHEFGQKQSKLSGTKSRTLLAEEQVLRSKRACDAVSSNVGKPCGECGKPHTQADLAKAQEIADGRLRDAGQAYRELKQTLDIDEIACAEAAEALQQHRKGMTDISIEQAKLQALRGELTIQHNMARDVQRLVEAAKRAGDDFKRIAGETNPFADLVEQLRAQLDQYAKAHTEAQAALEKADEAVQYASAVVDVYASGGVRAHRLDEATPYLNERTSHYLGSLTDGKIEAFWTTLTLSKDGKTLQDKFSIAVEKGGAGSSFKSLSGGEKRKVRLSCALALQDLVTSRAAKSIELWVGDEVDDALDDAGLERLMGVLEEKAREKGTLLVISHNDIAAYARQSIIVSKKDDISTVRVA